MLGGGIKYYAKIIHFQLSGSQTEEIEGSTREEALCRAIANLGENRWELVGENPYGRLFVSSGMRTPVCASSVPNPNLGFFVLEI